MKRGIFGKQLKTTTAAADEDHCGDGGHTIAEESGLVTIDENASSAAIMSSFTSSWSIFGITKSSSTTVGKKYNNDCCTGSNDNCDRRGGGVWGFNRDHICSCRCCLYSTIQIMHRMMNDMYVTKKI
jgi:hypothetical protein